jgi:hypothetical protein
MKFAGLSTKHIRQRMKYGKKTADLAATAPKGRGAHTWSLIGGL